MNFEQRVIRFFRELFELIFSNIWSFVFLIWVLNSLLGISIIDTKEPVKAPTQQTEQKKEDGPKPSM